MEGLIALKDFSEKIARDGKSTATETYLVLNSVRADIAASFVGGIKNVGGILRRVLPTAYDDIPGLVCNDVNFDPVGIEEELLASPETAAFSKEYWKYCWMTVNYGTSETQKDENKEAKDLVDVKIEISAESLTMPKGKVKWDGGPNDGKVLKDTDFQPAIIIPQTTLSLTLYDVVDFDDELMELYEQNMGKVNVATWRGRQPETVLFLNAEPSRKITTLGYEAWDISYKFLIKPRARHWNLTPDTSDPDNIIWRRTKPASYQKFDIEAVLGI